jgi:hypothetical protein
MTIQNSTRPTEVERMDDVMDIAACIYIVHGQRITIIRQTKQTMKNNKHMQGYHNRANPFSRKNELYK